MNSEPSSSSLKRKYDAFSDSTPSASCPRKYDVFLSFRGEDTRKGFVSHLYDALDRRGVHTYIDKEQLDKGTTIAPELVKAIEESRSAIVVLSRNYASSTWCLEELWHILKCCQEKDNNYKAFPVFYYVKPTDVRKLTGDFREGFDKNGEVIKENISKIEKWREALHEIADLSGWELKDDDNQTEAELINIIVEKVSISVPPNELSIVNKDYVGMDVRLNKLNQLLDLESKKVLAVGICGMGGIGKTTIAEFIFEQIKNKFEASCFVENVKDILKRKGLPHIQKFILKYLLGSSVTIQNSINGRMTLRSRLCGKRVLIVLDDVNKLQGLEDLIGKGDIRHLCFGEGSRIIITTRDMHLLKTNGVDGIYEVEALSFRKSCRLLYQKAFKENFTSSIEEYSDAFERIVRYANGHPLGLDVFSSLSIERNFIGAFEGIVRYANGHPLALSVLGSSLHGRNVNEWMDTLDQLKQYPNQEILGSLKLSYDGLNEPDKEIFLDIACFFNHKLYWNEMLRSFRSCSDISIRNLESKSLISTRFFLKMHELLSELGKHIVTEESPNNPGKRSRICGFNDVFEVLTNNLGTDAVEVIGHLGYKPLSYPLRWTVDSLLKMPNLKCLISQYASIEFLTYKCDDEPRRRSSTVLKKLVVVNLTGSNFICDSIDFSIVPNLQRLYLCGCRNLRELDQSVGSLKQLVHLDLSSSDIECLPSNIGNLSNLEELNLSFCTGLQLPNSLLGLCSLVILDLSGCRLGDGAIPDDIGSLSSLKELYLRRNDFTSIPESISQLFKLTNLDLNYCNNLVCLPKHLPLSLRILDTEGSDLLARYLPIWNLHNGEQVPLIRCRKSEDEYKIPRDEGSIKCFRIWEHTCLWRVMLLKIIWPLSEIPKCCRSRESCIKTEIPKGYMKRYELCVVYEVLGLDDGYSTLESTHVRKDFLCYFNTDQGSLKHPLEFDILISKMVGLYGLLIYIPEYWFGDQLNGASFLQASVDSINGSHIRLKACNGQFISNRSTFFEESLNMLDNPDSLMNPDSLIMANYHSNMQLKKS